MISNDLVQFNMFEIIAIVTDLTLCSMFKLTTVTAFAKIITAIVINITAFE